MICRNITLFVLVLASPLTAQAPAVRLTDINTQYTGPAAMTDLQGHVFFVREMVRVGNLLWFSADDGIHGVELWSTDGTELGTLRRTDLCPGRCSAHPRALTALGNRLFFVADDGVHGSEPWITDGTVGGTVLLADVWPGLGDGGLAWAVASPTHVAFSGFTPDEGWEPWVTDGTPAGTHLLSDLAPGPAGSYAEPIGAFGSRMFFSADDEVHGREVWSSDGTPASLVLLETMPGPASGVDRFMNLGAQTATAPSGLVFLASDPSHGAELWISDGSTAGTRLVADVNPGAPSANPYYLTRWNDRLYFFADDGVHERELWTTDGTAEGTWLVFDRSPAPFSGSPRSLQATPVGLFFQQFTNESTGQLWFSDGTVEGSRVLPGTRFVVAFPPPVATGTGLLFHGFDDAHGTEPWFSDGTEAGTLRLADLVPGPESSFETWDYVRGWRRDSLDGRAYFWVYSPGADFELWSSDGTPAGTHQVADVNAMASSIRVDRLYYYFNGPDYTPVRPAATAIGLVFLAGDGPVAPTHPTAGTTGLELWHVLHENGEVWPLGDLEPGPASFFPQALEAASTGAVFSDSLNRLWRTDGTPSGTALLPGVPAAGSLVRLPGAVVGSGFALSLDLGTVTNLPFGGPSLTTDGTRAFSSTFDQAALGASDGTVEGSRGLLLPSGYTGNPTGAGPGNVVFAYASPSEDYEPWVWRNDGTAELLADIRPGPEGSFDTRFLLNVEWEDYRPVLRTAGDTAYFRADDGLHGPELWATDGTSPGTRLVADLFPGTRGSDLRRLIPLGSHVFFVADDGVHGRELWVSDGTALGTRMVRDLAPGSGSAVPQELTAIGNFLVFNAWTPERGRELWISDGTEVGTRQLVDIAPGPASSSPVTFVAAGGWLYFTANDNLTGDELWRLPLNLLQPGTIFADGFETGDLAAWSTP